MKTRRFFQTNNNINITQSISFSHEISYFSLSPSIHPLIPWRSKDRWNTQYNPSSEFNRGSPPSWPCLEDLRREESQSHPHIAVSWLLWWKRQRLYLELYLHVWNSSCLSRRSPATVQKKTHSRCLCPTSCIWLTPRAHDHSWGSINIKYFSHVALRLSFL